MGNGLIYEALGRQIAARRQMLDKTQEQLAREIGISRASLANIERGRQNVYVHQIIKIAQALGLASARDLIPERPVPSAPKRISVQIDSGDRLTASQRKQIDAVVVESDRKVTSL